MSTIKDEIIAILDKQNAKGLKKYNHTLDECPADKYDWNTMIIEELVDALQYAVKENQRLRDLGDINRLCSEAYSTAVSKGWYDEPIETGTKLALIHSEVSEALEADRKGNADNFAEELADVCIRIFDLCGSRNIDLEKAITEKMEFNKTRPHKHGGKRY